MKIIQKSCLVISIVIVFVLSGCALVTPMSKGEFEEEYAKPETPHYNRAANVTYWGSVDVEISSSTGSMIYYTTDGSKPTTDNYTGKGEEFLIITLSSHTTLRAFAEKRGHYSAYKYASYTVN